MKSTFIYLIILVVSLSSGPVAKSQSYYSEQASAKIYTDLQLALRDPFNVYKLDLSDQELTSIPQEIYQFENLEYLVLDRNQIVNPTFPSNKLLSLKYISLKENGIREFRIFHDCLSQLKELYLDLNELIEYPEINNSFIELITLSLRNNYITTLPLEDLNLSRVRFLYLDSNPLKNTELAFTYSIHLERLSLFKTQLKAIPNDIQLKQLTALNVGSNALDLNTITPEAFPKLEQLEVSYNEVKNETDFTSITKLKSLKQLSAEGMQIKAISSDFGKMKKLREISLLQNSIKELPNSFYQLKLKLINIEKNPITEKTKIELESNFPKATIRY
ncbi:MAG: leucine-rich repeat domain-containing protein [Salibacteraceae bacterium]